MNDTLWGVAIGGAVAVVSALITSVVGPAMTARHQRATSRAERLLVAVAEVDAAMDGWSIGEEGEEGYQPFGETEMGVTSALRRLANASNNSLLQLAIDKAFDEVMGVGAVIGKRDELPSMRNVAISDAVDSVDEATRIAADMVDPPFLPIRVTRWVRRRRSLRRLVVRAASDSPLGRRVTALVSVRQRQKRFTLLVPRHVLGVLLASVCCAFSS